ncbi:MAG: YdbL family protein [Pseudomonadota bacterium]
MKRKFLFSIASAAAAVAAGSALSGSASAASAAIESAKRQCVIGERLDGYLGAVRGQRLDAALKREVDSVNMRRKAAYSDLARQRGVTIETAAAVTAERLIERAPSGQCVQNNAGAWVRVP